MQESCQNYIRILTITTPGSLLACGTNAFRPMCHYYNVTGSKYHLEKAKPGQALCPYGPKHNSTSVFVGEFKKNIEFDKKIACSRNCASTLCCTLIPCICEMEWETETRITSWLNNCFNELAMVKDMLSCYLTCHWLPMAKQRELCQAREIGVGDLLSWDEKYFKILRNFLEKIYKKYEIPFSTLFHI